MDIREIANRFGSDLDTRAVALQRAVGHENVSARYRRGGLEAERVIRRPDMASGNVYVIAAIDVQAVAVSDV